MIFYDKATEIDSGLCVVWCNKWISLNKLVRYEEALICFDRALKIDTQDWTSWEAKGNSLGMLERYEEAIDCYDKALEIRPGLQLASQNRQVCQRRLGKGS